MDKRDTVDVTDYHRVRALATKLKDSLYCTVFDKNAKCMAYCCKKWMTDKLEEEFNTDGRFERVPACPLAWLIMTAYPHQQPHRSHQLPRAYALIKKDCNRIRVITSHYGDGPRHALQLGARALNVIDRTATTATNAAFNMSDVRDWVKGLPPTYTHLSEFDASNMYFAVDSPRALDSLDRWILAFQRAGYSGVFLSNYRSCANLDHPARSTGRHIKKGFKYRTWSWLQKLIKWDIQCNSFFSAPTGYYHQVKGLPMGGFVSPGVASLSCSLTSFPHFASIFNLSYIRYKDNFYLAQEPHHPIPDSTICTALKSSLGMEFKVEQEGSPVLDILDFTVQRLDDPPHTIIYPKTRTPRTVFSHPTLSTTNSLTRQIYPLILAASVTATLKCMGT